MHKLKDKTEIKKGTPIVHGIHGEGRISSTSPDRRYAVCAYPKKNGRDEVYRLTHRIADLKVI